MTRVLVERALRRLTDRPKRVVDHELIGRIELDLEAEDREQARRERRKVAVEACAREGHQDPTEDGCEITAWGSATPIHIAPGCPRCGEPVEPVTTISATGPWDRSGPEHSADRSSTGTAECPGCR